MLVLAMVVAFTFTSCKNKEKCWKVTAKVGYYYDGEYYYDKISEYVWGSENDLEIVIEDIEDQYENAGYEVSISYEKSKKSEDDCDDYDINDLENDWL